MVATPIKPALKPVAEVDTDTLVAQFLKQRIGINFSHWL